MLSDDGKKSEINSPENVKALQLMVDGVKDKAAANGVTTYMEEESRRYFESGKATYMRNWPYAYALGEKAAAVKGKFDVMPFPEFEGGGKAGILGGHNQVVSVYSKNPGGALKWIIYITGAENQKNQFIERLAVADAEGDLRRPGGAEEVRVRDAAARRHLAGQVAAGLARLPAGLAGDLQERQRGPGGQGHA